MEKLKVEIFDIIRQQDILKLQYAELEKVKTDKLQQLQKKEKDAIQTKPKSEVTKS